MLQNNSIPIPSDSMQHHQDVTKPEDLEGCPLLLTRSGHVHIYQHNADSAMVTSVVIGMEIGEENWQTGVTV